MHILTPYTHLRPPRRCVCREKLICSTALYIAGKLQCVAALQCVAVWCSVLQCDALYIASMFAQYGAVCCSVLQCVAVCCSVHCISRVCWHTFHTATSGRGWVVATAPCCNTLQHTATHCTFIGARLDGSHLCVKPEIFCNTMHNTLQHTVIHTATHCKTLQHTTPASGRGLVVGTGEWPMRCFATHCNTLQHTATHCNTLQHTATHCNTLDLH